MLKDTAHACTKASTDLTISDVAVCMSYHLEYINIIMENFHCFLLSLIYTKLYCFHSSLPKIHQSACHTLANFGAADVSKLLIARTGLQLKLFMCHYAFMASHCSILESSRHHLYPGQGTFNLSVVKLGSNWSNLPSFLSAFKSDKGI